MPEFRITPEWLIAHGACAEGRAVVPGPMTIREAFSAALEARHPDWCEWGTARLLALVSLQDSVRFACRCARRVQHLWPKAGREAGERAVSLAERWAAGESVTEQELWAAAYAAAGAAAVAAWYAAGDAAGAAAGDAAWLAIADDLQRMLDAFEGRKGGGGQG